MIRNIRSEQRILLLWWYAHDFTRLKEKSKRNVPLQDRTTVVTSFMLNEEQITALVVSSTLEVK